MNYHIKIGIILTLSFSIFNCGGGPLDLGHFEANIGTRINELGPDMPSDYLPITQSQSPIQYDELIITISVEYGSIWSELKYSPAPLVKLNLISQAHAAQAPPPGLIQRKLRNITITSDSNFSNEHPAGSNLNNLFAVEYYGPNEFTNYTGNWYQLSIADFIQTIDDTDPQTWKNIEEILQIRLNTPPSSSKTHQFTIKIDDSYYYTGGSISTLDSRPSTHTSEIETSVITFY